jgi:hypothetical protein
VCESSAQVYARNEGTHQKAKSVILPACPLHGCDALAELTTVDCIAMPEVGA